MVAFAREALSARNCAIWECTEWTRQECLEKGLFGEPSNSPRLKQKPLPSKGDICFLLDLSTDELLGVFIAESDIGTFDPEAWQGRFSTQQRVRPLGEIKVVINARQKLRDCGVLMTKLRGHEVPLHFVHPPEVTRRILDFFPDEALGDAVSPAELEDVLFVAPREGLDRVAGLEPVKRFIKERMVEPFRYPNLSARYRLRIGGGVLLFGPPGTGKTLIAQATAAELEAEFLEISPSVIRGFPGDAERRLEALFERALRSPRTVIFLDEAEALMSRREEVQSSVMQRVVPVLLSLFSKVSSRQDRPVLIIAATNYPWGIDEAFLRPGRLDVRLLVGLPNIDARKELIKMNLEGRPHAFTEDSIHRLAERLDGWTGADIKDLFDRAAFQCFQQCPKPATADEEVDEQNLALIRPEEVMKLADRMKPSVSSEDYQKYLEWNEKYGTSQDL